MNPGPRSADEIFFSCGRLSALRIQERSFADLNIYIVVFFYVPLIFYAFIDVFCHILVFIYFN